MQTVLIFLGGFLIGGFFIRGLMMRSERRQAAAHELAIPYESIKRTVLKYLQSHGTINRPQLEQLISADRMTAVHCLYRIEREGHIKRQGHDPLSGFYTLS